jgi:Spy/CpxP family protein refolding chaperone
MKNVKAIIGIVLVFVLGAASGAVVTHMVYRDRMATFIKGGPESREEVIVSRLTRKLSLDVRQQEQVKAIVHEDHLAIRQIRNQYRPQIQGILEQGQARIMALLNPEQRDKFRKILEERRNRHPADGPP